MTGDSSAGGTDDSRRNDDQRQQNDDQGTRNGDQGTRNDGQVFDRLPATAADRQVEGRATREAVVEWWVERFGLEAAAFDGYTFWEKGAGKVWVTAADVASPARVEALGMTFLRTRQEHWKPTTDAVQRFGRGASRNVVVLDADDARAFLRGEDLEPGWDGDWGYLVVAHEIAGDVEPIGVGLYVHDELRSQVPKGRRREL